MSSFLRGSVPDVICNFIDEHIAITEAIDELIADEQQNDEISSENLTVRRPMFDRSYTGGQYVADLLAGHPQRAYNCFRLSPQVFGRLKDLIVSRGLLMGTRNISVDEQLGIFLRCVAHSQSFRQICEFFQHSLETVSRTFNKVLKVIVSLSDEFIAFPPMDVSCHTHIESNRHFFPFFENAIGAIDGTHIHTVVSKTDQNRYRNRKGFTSQNVLAAVSFDRQFVYLAAGWEGSAADMRVLRWAVEEDDFIVPHGKYYLADSGYANTDKFLTPYRGNRYHLSDYQGEHRRRYSNAREVYNHRHAQLRNVVERTFGIWKERFQVLSNMHRFPSGVQTDIIIACAVLHNFIGRCSDNDYFFNMSQTEMSHDRAMGEASVHEDDPNVHASIGERKNGDAVRSAIATLLWDDCVSQRG